MSVILVEKKNITDPMKCEIIYRHFSDDDLSAEFIHVKGGECIREFRRYFDDEDSNVDMGILPCFDS